MDYYRKADVDALLAPFSQLPVVTIEAPAPTPVPTPVPEPTKPGEPDAIWPLPAELADVQMPVITPAAARVGDTLTRVPASQFPPGWSPVQGRWYVNGGDENIGIRATQSTMALKGGDRVQYWEWWRGPDGTLVVTKSPTVALEAAAPAPGPAPSGRMQSIIDDMRLPSDATPVNFPYDWGKRAYNMMGNLPNAQNTANWWAANRSAYPGWWRTIIAWSVLFEAVGNKTVAPRLNIAFFDLQMKIAGAWRLLGRVSDMGGNYQKQDGSYYGGDNKAVWRREPDGTYSLALRPALNWHGYGIKVAIPDPMGVQGVHGVVRARLIGDDIDRARWMLDAAADYYPTDQPPAMPTPNVANSRARLLTGDWQDITFTTFSDAGVQDPGAAWNPAGGISIADFLANPPPAPL